MNGVNKANRAQYRQKAVEAGGRRHRNAEPGCFTAPRHASPRVASTGFGVNRVPEVLGVREDGQKVLLAVRTMKFKRAKFVDSPLERNGFERSVPR